MKALGLMVVIVAALALSGVAAASPIYTASQINKETKLVIVKRLAFVGDRSVRFVSARCQGEGDGNHFFCIVRVSSGGMMLDPFYYSVSVSPTGYIKWALHK